MKKIKFCVIALLPILSSQITSCKQKGPSTPYLPNVSTERTQSTSSAAAQLQQANSETNSTDTLLKFPKSSFSIRLNKSWKYTINNNSQTVLYATKPNGKNQFSIHLTQIPDGVLAAVTPADMPEIKQGMINSLKERNCVVKEFNIKMDVFKNYKSYATSALIIDPTEMEGRLHHFYTIQFIHRNFLFNISYKIAETSNASTDKRVLESELNNIIFE